MDLRTGAAFWPLKSGLIGVYPPLDRDERCESAVLGAGPWSSRHENTRLLRKKSERLLKRFASLIPQVRLEGL